MPLISIETNQAINDPSALSDISKAIATLLDKPESYVMVKYTHNKQMLFAGNTEPLAHLKLKSLGLPEDQTSEFSAQLCSLIETHFSVAPARTYIEFINPQRHMWGWNSSIF